MCGARLSTACRGSMLALALGATAWVAAPLHAQAPNDRMAHRGAILVQAVDTSINPITAEIVLPRFGFGVRLSEEGVVLLMNIPDGTYLVQARLLGYRPEWRVVRIAGDTARADFILPPADPSKAVGYALADSRLREFLRRSAAIQYGAYITRSEIERRRPKNLANLLGRVREITVDRRTPGPTVLRSKRAKFPQCTAGMLLFVDGMLPSAPTAAAGKPEQGGERRRGRMLRPERASFGAAGVGGNVSPPRPTASARDIAGVDQVAPPGPTGARRALSPVDWVPLNLVAGVEVYPTYDDVPSEFRVAGAECGAVLIWTVRT